MDGSGRAPQVKIGKRKAEKYNTRPQLVRHEGVQRLREKPIIFHPSDRFVPELAETGGWGSIEALVSKMAKNIPLLDIVTP